MLPTRYVPGQSSAMRKSRLEGKPSLLPKPRRPGSTDRLSTEARRPSTVGQRSSSADPRGTFGGSRLSREASATKLPLNGRSRSQQSERFGQSSMTPLRGSHYSSRPTTTPVRTPSEDRASRSWQTSLERALAFVTIKDQRPLSNAGWQRAECARVQEALARRGAADGSSMALIRPLTIARFVDIAGALLAAVTRDAKLNNDNYVAKLPHLSKRLLYPGTVSKSWLKTVNTLHAFPHALALIAYLLDLVNYIEMPVSDDWLYVGKDELACLRRDYLYKCWIRFQDPGHEFEDLNEEYLQNLKLLLGNDEEKIMELQQLIKKYETCLEDEAEAAARADEARRVERRDALLSGLRAERAARRAAIAEASAQRALHTDHTDALRQLDVEIERATAKAGRIERRDALLSGRRVAIAEAAAQRALHTDHTDALRQLDVEIERATAESQQLKREVEQQPLTVAERTRLLDDVDYALRVQDSKRALAIQIDKMLLSKETELALWQKKTLDSCVEYKQGLIHLSAQFPELASLAIDEKELMGSECAAWVQRAVEALRTRSQRLADQRAEFAASKSALCRKRAMMLDETRTKITELKATIQREQESLDNELSREASEASAWSLEQRELSARLDALRAHQDDYARLQAELDCWERQDDAWRAKLKALEEYIESQRVEIARELESARAKRLRLFVETVRAWDERLAQ